MNIIPATLLFAAIAFQRPTSGVPAPPFPERVMRHVPKCLDNLPMVGCCEASGDFNNCCDYDKYDCFKIVDYDMPTQCLSRKRKYYQQIKSYDPALYLTAPEGYAGFPPRCLDNRPMVGCCEKSGGFSNFCEYSKHECIKVVDYNKPTQCPSRKRLYQEIESHDPAIFL